MIIQQGDQYTIPVVVKRGDTIFTDENITGLKIAIGNTVHSYPNGELKYEDDAWQFPLTQKVSLSFPSGKADFQAQVKIGDKIVGTPVRQVDISESIIKGEW